MKFLVKILLFSANIPLYFIAKLVPKNKNIWIFGAWFGEKYCDNSKYLFEYVNCCKPNVRAIWLTKNKDVYELIKSKGYEVYFTYSFKGYLYSAKSNVSFSSTSVEDINKFLPAKYLVNLWHGIPLKKIGYSDSITFKDNKLKSRILRLIFPFKREIKDSFITCASSNIEALNLSEAFQQPIENILISGLPRNDVFKGQESQGDYKVLYMPTHRNEGELDIKELFLNDIDLINDRMMKIGVTIYIKLHYYHLSSGNIMNMSNIIFIKDEDIEQDIYTLLPNVDVLITDYSSVYFDYLLANKPIIFAPFDYERYLTKDRELYFDYDKFTPGPKCKSWNEVLDWVVRFKNDNALYSKERHAIKNKVHAHIDSKGCERVYNRVFEL